MFIRNSTTLDVSLTHGHVSSDVALGAVVATTVFEVADDRLVRAQAKVAATETDPPDDLGRFTLWSGVSVTAAGFASGPSKPPFVCPVLFRIGAVERRLIVFGERRWERRLGGGLEASSPAPFDRVALGFDRAFGGGYDVPPGLLPGTDLPHPGARVTYPMNERGVGFYPDERAAAGALLPSIERPDQLVRRWNDAPEPAGFSPCRELVFWRMRDAVAPPPHGSAEDPGIFLRAVAPALRVQHHAPPLLLFDDVPPGTPIELRGLGAGPIRFAVPPAPAAVSVRAQKRETTVAPRLRSLHVDAARSIVRVVHDHTFRYDPRHPPSWVRIQDGRTGAS